MISICNMPHRTQKTEPGEGSGTLVFLWQLESPPALPGNAVHSLLIGGRHQEADGGDDGLAAPVVQHPPLVGLGVIQQGTLIAPVDRDLGGGQR